MIDQRTLAQERSTADNAVRRIAFQAGVVVASTALVALCAHISVPLGFTPVPITLQPFAVLLLGLLLAPQLSFAALALYLLEGTAGLPVFSPHGLGGIAQLFGPTGGYLLAAPFAAATAGLIYRNSRDGKRKLLFALAGAAVGDVILLAIGALWLGVLTQASLSTLLSESVVPFLASDAAKVVAAAVCAQVFASFSGTSFFRRSSETE
ncbi:MAG TPA: biotin transporter BioY [Acidobacteriaceae bacterium]|jgi:biotin transport system substrate-specific component